MTLDNESYIRLVAKREPGMYDVWEWVNGQFILVPKYFEYTSGWLQSKKQFKYGLFQINCKMPIGQGLWPAFWLYGNQPAWEEIDIFEYKGETPDRIHYDIHCPDGCDNYWPFLGIPYNFGDWINANGNFSDGFNDLMVEWGPTACFWYLNEHEYAIWLGTLDGRQSPRLNLAIPKDNCPFEPSPNSDTQFPAYFDINYVRFWTRIDCQQSVNICNYFQQSTDPTVITGNLIEMGGVNCQSSLNSNQYLQLIAADEIILKPGFAAINGSDFYAKLVDCSYSNASIRIDDKSHNNYQQLSTNVISNENIFLKSQLPQKLLMTANIYPNPTQGKITVEFIGEINNDIQIDLIDATGQIVYTQASNLLNKIEVDISHFPKGQYLLKGTFGTSSISNIIILN